MDTHVDSHTYTKKLRANLYVYSCTIPFASRYMTKLEERCLAPMCSNFLNTSHLLSSLLVCPFFSLSYSGIPVTKSHCVWPDYNGYRHTEWARSEYIFIVKEQIPISSYRNYYTYYQMHLRTYLTTIQLQTDSSKNKVHLPA